MTEFKSAALIGPVGDGLFFHVKPLSQRSNVAGLRYSIVTSMEKCSGELHFLDSPVQTFTTKTCHILIVLNS